MRTKTLGLADSGRSASGFSLIELLLSIAIIMIMAAVSIPAISKFIRNYRIKSAQQQVASEINNARARAIRTNVNYGVVFVTTSTRTFRWVIEDTPGNPPSRTAIPTILTDDTYKDQRGPERNLPDNVLFASAATCGNAANDAGLRFDRYGAWCDPGATTNCPAMPSPVSTPAPGGVQNMIYNSGGGSTICLVSSPAGLTKTVQVSSGGRVSQP